MTEKKLFKKLLFSRPFDVHKRSSYPEVVQFTEVIYSEFKVAGIVVNNSKKNFEMLTVLLLDLYVCWKTNPAAYIGISLNNNSYVSTDRYSSLFIKRFPLIKSFKGLAQLGYIEAHKGWMDRMSGKSYLTRMRASEKLIHLFTNSSIKLHMIERDPDQEIIILKNEDKEKVDYQDNDRTMMMRERLTHINQHLSFHLIDLGISDVTYAQMIEELYAEKDTEEWKVIDLFNNKYLHRVFNNSKWEQGGRFYGAFWQQIPSEYRKYITIDDTPTVEIDFSSMHPRMLYHTKNLIAPAEPYNVITDLPRKQVKIIMNIMLNAKCEDSARKAIKRAYNDLSSEDINSITSKILNHHNSIKDAFYKSYGLELMFLDSIIAEKVMMRAIDQYKTIVLPVHDSFICVESFAPILQNLMNEAYNEVVSYRERLSARFKVEQCSVSDPLFCYLQGEIEGYSLERNQQLRIAASEARKKHNIHIETDFDHILLH